MIFKPKCPECGQTEDFCTVADFKGEVVADAVPTDGGGLKQDGEFSNADCSYGCFNARFQCCKCRAEFDEPDKEPGDDEARRKIAHDQSEKQGQTNFLTGANR